MTEKGPNTPVEGGVGDKNVGKEKALVATLTREVHPGLKNWAAEQIRKMIYNREANMGTISSEELKKKLLEVYKEGKFDLTEEEARFSIKVFSENFCKRREELKNKSMKERKLYLLGSIAQYYQENGEEEKAEAFDKILENLRENGKNSIDDPLFDPENSVFDPEEVYNYVK